MSRSYRPGKLSIRRPSSSVTVNLHPNTATLLGFHARDRSRSHLTAKAPRVETVHRAPKPPKADQLRYTGSSPRTANPEWVPVPMSSASSANETKHPTYVHHEAELVKRFCMLQPLLQATRGVHTYPAPNEASRHTACDPEQLRSGSEDWPGREGKAESAREERESRPAHALAHTTPHHDASPWQ